MAGVLPFVAALFAQVPAVPPQSGPVVQFAQVLNQPVLLSIDGGATEQAPPLSKKRFALEPGRHTFTITTSTGRRIEATYDLRAEDAAEVKGGRFWCVLLVGETVEDEAGADLLRMSVEGCRDYIKLGKD